MSGVTIRTLHFYDEIGLLKPAERSQKKYRYYDEDNLLRLQQILFYREFDFTLEQIRDILDNPDFDYVSALRAHRETLLHKHERIDRLIHTLDKTIEKIQGDQTMTLRDKDLYEGFDQETIDRWNREVEDKYDPETVAESRRNIEKMGKEKFKDVKQRGEDVTRAIAERMEMGADSPEVQAWVAEHHKWIENFYTCPADIYRGLGQLYIENPEFTAYYEQIQPGLARFMAEAMAVYADRSL